MHADLTIVLPLKGRHLHTLRFLWHANYQRLPFIFLIADAEPHPAVQRAIQENKFPNIELRYCVYPPDRDFSCFYSKMASAIEQVETPYVMLADNDDFLLGTGIGAAVDFLKAHTDYIGCGGAVMGFDIEFVEGEIERVTGKLQSLKAKYNSTYNEQDFSLANSIERLQFGYDKSNLYYLISKKDIFEIIFSEIKMINMTYLPLYEAFFCMRMLSIGKVHVNHSFSNYMRQYGTSLRSSGLHKHRSLVYSTFSSDLDQVVSVLSAELTQHENQGKQVIENAIRDLYVPKLESILKRDHEASKNSKKSRIILAAKSKLKSLVNKIPGKILIDKLKVKNYLRTHGAPDSYLALFLSEINAIETTLACDEFTKFLSDVDASSNENPLDLPS